MELDLNAKRKRSPKVKRRKIRYIRHQFSISQKENDKLKRLSAASGMSLNKLIKKSLHEYLHTHQKDMKGELENENQLNLFQNPVSIQLSIPLD